MVETPIHQATLLTLACPRESVAVKLLQGLVARLAVSAVLGLSNWRVKTKRLSLTLHAMQDWHQASPLPE